ncbi:MAG: DUF6134 family protein [Parvibaculales bacterium]
MSAKQHPFQDKLLHLPADKQLRFLIYRNGKNIGYHQLDFEELENGSVRVNIHIDIIVKLGFIKVYDFLHKSEEIWDGNALQSLQSRTFLNGENARLNIRRVNDMLVLDNGETEELLAGNLKPASYWFPGFTQELRLIDSASGKILEMDTLYKGEDKIEDMQGHYFVANKDIPIDILYSQDGKWLGSRYGKNRDVVYVFDEKNQVPPAHKWRKFDD